MATWYAVQSRRVGAAEMWKTQLRTRAKTGERIVLEQLVAYAEDGPISMEYRAVVEGSDGDFGNPRQVLGFRYGVREVLA